MTTITKELLEELYNKNHLTMVAISRRLGLCQGTITKLFKKFGIKKRPVGSHLNTTQDQKVANLIKKFPHIKLSDIGKAYEDEKKSLPEISEETGLNFRQIQCILTFLGIKLRSISESKLTRQAKEKIQTTLRSKYGVENISQIEEVKRKKQQTCLAQFGVDNFFKRQDFKKLKEVGYFSKYGISCSQYRSKMSQKVWSEKSPEDRKKWLENSILNDESIIKNIGGYQSSRGENRISSILAKMGIFHSRQYVLKYQHEGRKRRYLYDIFIPELNCIIEYNGDYWHANPRIYHPTDVFHYPNGTRTASERWQQDLLKKQLAQERGCVIIEIWEDEEKKLSDVELYLLIQERIKNEVHKN